MALTTVTQVETVLGRTLAPAEAMRAAELISMVTDMIADRLGRSPETASFTNTFTSPPTATVFTTRFPLASVESVTVGAEALTVGDDYAVDLRRGTITRMSSAAPSPWGTGTVEVAATSATIPELSVLCAIVVGRTLSAQTRPASMAGLRQLTVGRWSATVDTASEPVAALALTDTDAAIVDAWRERRP